MPSALVIGGTGFIGAHLARKMVDENWDVTSWSTSPPQSFRLVKKVKYHQLDYTLSDNLKCYANAEFDYVVNLGGHVDHRSFFHPNNDPIAAHFLGLKNLVSILPRTS